MATRRTFQLSLLAVIFAGMSLAAFEYARRMIVDPSPVVQFGLQPRAVINIAVFVGIAAVSVAIAAWLRSRWLPWAIGLWGLSVGVAMYEFQSRTGTRGDPMWLVVFPYVMLIILTWLLAAFGAARV